MICGGTDWCSFGDHAVICRRIESEKPHEDRSGNLDGWYHFYEEKQKPNIPTRKIFSKSPLLNASSLIDSWRRNTAYGILRYQAAEFGVSFQSLKALGMCWSQKDRALAFPMHDQNGICGIRLRNREGMKWAVPGSKGGIFMPDDSIEQQEMVLLPEGPTDTAAAITMGFYSWGRPNCNSGGEIIRDLIRSRGIRKAVVVSDHDEIKRNGSRPGLEGALRLKAMLGIPSVIFIPPLKDLREYLKAGATKQMIESQLNQKVWSKK